MFCEGIKRNKKGSLLDVIFMAGICLFASIVILIGYKVVSEFNDQIQIQDGVPTIAKQNVAELEGTFPGAIDNSFLFLTIALAIGALVLASLVRISPIFIAIYLIALVFVIFMSGILSNIYQEMAANSLLTAEADNLTFISNILAYLPMIIGVIGSILAIVMFKSWQNAQV